MGRYKSLILALGFCVLLTGFTQAEEADDLNEQEQALTIALTKFDVNETRLELQWNIKNNSDHDVWICSSVDPFKIYSEVFMDEDNKTLMIRRRFDVPAYGILFSLPYARYIRLSPGANRPESLSLNVPIYSKDRFGSGFYRKSSAFPCKKRANNIYSFSRKSYVNEDSSDEMHRKSLLIKNVIQSVMLYFFANR